MDKRFIFFVLLAIIIFQQCAKPGREYFIPDDMNKDSRKNLVSYLNKGKELYKEFCSGCHGIYAETKDNSPSFTEYQLEMYKAKLSMRQGEQHGFTENLSYEETESILNFLRFKKPSKTKF